MGVTEINSSNISNYLNNVHGRYWLSQPRGQTGGGLVIFAASWCVHCQRLAKTLHELEVQNPDHKASIYIIDVDENPKIMDNFKALGYEASGYPTILQFFPSGLIGPLRYTGNRDAASLSTLLNQINRLQ